ncbi:MAG: peptide-methionine (S)-S-oxide reductase MsrA [Proteobacteria bacterium]|nr:peptide-methionine (S)-S-oxide reductase MsrA [Burkholderiales bacterium]
MRAGLGWGFIAGALLTGSVAAQTVSKPMAPAAAPGATTLPAGSAIAILAGGCFWCIEADMEKLPGVLSAESGYINGKVDRPTYKQVSAGGTGHTEAIRVVFDPARITYERILEHFWRNIDPTVKDAQFCDVGNQYRSGIYFIDAAQQKAAEASRDALLSSKKFPRIHTEIAPAGTFWVAEEYHQDYYKKNPIRYQFYRSGCGRDARLADLWGKPTN